MVPTEDLDRRTPLFSALLTLGALTLIGGAITIDVRLEELRVCTKWVMGRFLRKSRRGDGHVTLRETSNPLRRGARAGGGQTI